MATIQIWLWVFPSVTWAIYNPEDPRMAHIPKTFSYYISSGDYQEIKIVHYLI